MARRLLSVLAAGALVTLACAASAAAQCGQQAPGDNSQIDQYLETTPGACGNQPTGGEDADGGADDDGSGASSPAPTSISPETAASLEELGPDGDAVARLAEETSPDDRDSGNGGAPDAPASAGGDSASGIAAAGDALTGSDDDGLGLMLPLILAAAAIAGLGYALMRHRGSDAS